MAFVAGDTLVTGELITAAMWNNYLGAAGSIDYLKTEADKIDDCAQTDVTGSRAIDGTVYQNLTGKLKLVTVTAEIELDVGGESIRAYVENDATPAVEVARAGEKSASAESIDIYVALTFMVPNNWYYKVDDAGGTPVLYKWIEWDIH